jgi:hypothetical protein
VCGDGPEVFSGGAEFIYHNCEGTEWGLGNNLEEFFVEFRARVGFNQDTKPSPSRLYVFSMQNYRVILIAAEMPEFKILKLGRETLVTHL